MRVFVRPFLVAVCFSSLFAGACTRVFAGDERWWPVQSLPKALVIARERHSSLPQQMMVQSVAGLAAKAVNQARGAELIWLNSDNIDMQLWYQLFRKRFPDVEVRGEFGNWELVDRFVELGIIKGYILYSIDKSAGKLNDHRVGMDLSVNVATSLAGLIDGILIDDTLEQEARAHGLEKLFDVRDKTQQWCFDTYKDKFHRRLLCCQDPQKSNIRDLAIAHQALVLYGVAEPTESALRWLEPLSPIAGWNGGDEFETTRISSLHGHIQTATDWCMNLPVLMAGSEKSPIPTAKSFDQQSIDWNDERSCVSFVMTDGDNVQWFQSSFFHGNPSYWSSPDRGMIPFGWSCCFAQLAQLCPVAIDQAVETAHANDRFIEWGAGYYYPDLFGHARPNRDEVLAKHAERSWAFMKTTGTRIISFNVAKFDSRDALKAYDTIAKETDDLTAILVFEYSAYEAGAGKTFWVRDRRGIEIPVVSARYSIWENLNNRPRSGTPARIARKIQEHVANNASPTHDWVIVHAWSYFRNVPGADEGAENMSQDKAAAKGGIRGYSPAVWCAERLSNVHVVGPEELVWRIRMKHDAETTKKLIAP